MPNKTYNGIWISYGLKHEQSGRHDMSDRSECNPVHFAKKPRLKVLFADLLWEKKILFIRWKSTADKTNEHGLNTQIDRFRRICMCTYVVSSTTSSIHYKCLIFFLNAWHAMIQPKHNDMMHVAHRKLDKLQVYYSDKRLNQSEAFVVQTSVAVKKIWCS
jgi:hypothetical protein